MIVDSVNFAILLDETIVTLPAFRFLSIYRFKSGVRYHNDVVGLQLVRLHILDLRVGVVIDEYLELTVRVLIDLVLPLHQGYRGLSNSQTKLGFCDKIYAPQQPRSGPWLGNRT